MPDAVTFNDFPTSASQRYARDQRENELNPNFISDSRLAPRRTETAATTPYIGSKETEHLFTIGLVTIWAAFPSLTGTLSSPIFTHSLIPSLGTTDKLQKLLEKFKTAKDSTPSDQEHEYRSVLTLLQKLIELSRTFDLINGKRNQYHRG